MSRLNSLRPALLSCCFSSVPGREWSHKPRGLRALSRRDVCKAERMFISKSARSSYSSVCKCQRKEYLLKPQVVYKLQSRSKTGLIPKEEIVRFYKQCLVAAGATDDNAGKMATVLHAADHRGHVSHGINRIAMYVDELIEGSMNGTSKPCVLKETANTAWVDGKNTLGGVVGTFCMEMAIKKALKSSISLVVARASNHYGIGSYYTWMAMEKGLLGMSFSNTSPLVVPTGAKEAALGTNPMSVAACGDECDVFLLDMATSNVAVGKIELNMKKGVPIPKGWGLDEGGQPTTDARIAFEASRLMPLGGVDTGHKGYALCVMVEVFCGILGDSLFGPNIRKWMTTEKCANLGHAFLCINPECFAPGFQSRLSCLLQYLRSMEPADPKRPVLVPGDVEMANMKKNEDCGGICFDASQLKNMTELGKKMKVEPMTPK